MFVEINKIALKNLPFVLATIGESKPQSKIVRPDGLNSHQIIFVTDGTALFSFGSEKFTVKKGQGFFMRAGVAHEYEGDFSSAWMTFKMSTEALDYLNAGTYFQFNAPPNLYNEVSELIAFSIGNSNPLSRSATGYSFVTEFFSKVLSDKRSISDKILDILERRFSESLSLYDIADELKIDRYTLCRIYKKEKGITVMDDLYRIRISKAKKYLKIGNDSVSKIGFMCGFENPSYFIKRFKEVVGCTPFRYRKGF